MVESNPVIGDLCRDAAVEGSDGRYRVTISPLSFTIEFHRGSDSDWLLSDAYSPHAGDGRIAIYDRLWSPRAELLSSASATMVCRSRRQG